MPAINPAYSSQAYILPRYASEWTVVAPGADAREVRFLAGQALYSSQADNALVFDTTSEDIYQADASAQPAVLDQWALETAFRERDAVMAQLPALADYYHHINTEHIELASALVAYVLGQQLKPQALASHLTYYQSLHVRADLPNGAVHLSVIFESGVDPLNPTPDEDGDDANASVSFYDAQGILRAGRSGPLSTVLSQLASLAQWPTTVA